MAETERRPANDEMVQGFRDGYNISNPEPSGNRTASYRHGFMVARIDKGMMASPGIDALEMLADQAMAADEAGMGVCN